MSESLTLPGGVALVPKHSDEDFSDLAKSGDWLPRLQLMSSNSDACKEGKINIAHYALVNTKDSLTDLGKNVNIWVCGWRPKALIIDGGDGRPISYFDKESAEFKDVKTKSAIQNSGNLCGPEFLVFIPGKGFATFYMASKTARNQAPAVKALMGKCGILSAHLIENKSFKWHGPVVMESSVAFEQPNPEELAETIEKFNNPPASQIEKVTEDKTASSPEADRR